MSDISGQTQVNPSITLPPSNTSYFSKLLHGRLNRSGYLIGSVCLGFGLLPVALVLSTLLVLVASVEISILVTTGLVIIIAVFFSFSLSLRRLHDLNKSGYLLLFFIPGYLISLSHVMLGFTSILTNGDVTSYTLPAWLASAVDVAELIGLFVTIYLLFWPGTKTDNKYGPSSTHWSLKEIYGFATPPPKDSSKVEDSVSTKTPSATSKVLNFMVKILVGLVLFFIAFVGIIFLIGFLHGLFNF